MFGAKRVGGLRLRMPHASNGHAQHSPGPSLMNFQMAVTALKGAGIDVEILKQVLRSKGYAGYQPSRDTPTVLAMIEEARQPAQANQEESFDDEQSSEVPF